MHPYVYGTRLRTVSNLIPHVMRENGKIEKAASAVVLPNRTTSFSLKLAAMQP